MATKRVALALLVLLLPGFVPDEPVALGSETNTPAAIRPDAELGGISSTTAPKSLRAAVSASRKSPWILNAVPVIPPRCMESRPLEDDFTVDRNIAHALSGFGRAPPAHLS